jgi:dipeptidyl aminopeptidase/acylaminoacyl peptidase
MLLQLSVSSIIKRAFCLCLSLLLLFHAKAQSPLTPETLWKLGRLTPLGIDKDKKNVIFKVSTPSVENNQISTSFYALPVNGGSPVQIPTVDGLLPDKHLSPDGKHILFTQKVKLQSILGYDVYPSLKQSDARIYNALDYRHWDTWEDGFYHHLFYKPIGRPDSEGIDLLLNQRFHCPQKPWGGPEDYTWSPDGQKILYVSKKVEGTSYALSTNTDIFEFNIAHASVKNLTEGMMGYDTEPAFNKHGTLAWLSMKRNGYEADKNDIWIMSPDGRKQNLTGHWDGTINHFMWSEDGLTLYFLAPIQGTVQLFEITPPTKPSKTPTLPKPLTNGQFDITAIIGQVGQQLLLTRSDMNTASEIYAFDLKSKTLTQRSFVNQNAYNDVLKSNVKKRMVTTTDGQQMPVWVIYPPHFDSTKQYPTLLYCQGGPQSALTQFYSFRWNFQLMAAQGYIVVAPNRRGMPGMGTQWNEDISKDWGGQVMNDYLSAIDDVAKEPYVDKNRLGAVGASYGGYSVFYLAGIHQNRFKSFISHCGVFNLKSMYGTTEEVFFTDFDLGGPYWDQQNTDAQKAYTSFNPIEKVAQWNTPILIIQGGKDYRVPIGQGQEAFQAAQLLGIKSRFLYFPEENHWVLSPQNAMVWQKEFFKWLEETL